jgi:hypothetical protein
LLCFWLPIRTHHKNLTIQEKQKKKNSKNLGNLGHFFHEKSFFGLKLEEGSHIDFLPNYVPKKRKKKVQLIKIKIIILLNY